MISAGIFAIAVAAGGGHGIWGQHLPHGRLRTASKTFGVFLLMIAAGVSEQPSALVLALGLSALGDAALAEAGRERFLIGIGAFFAAHVAYIYLFLSLGDLATVLSGWRLVGTLLIVVLLVGSLVVVLPRTGTLAGPVIVFSGAIALMLVTVLSLPGSYWPVMLGVWLFVESDSALAVSLFLNDSLGSAQRFVRVLIWGTYFPAQALITAGFLFG